MGVSTRALDLRFNDMMAHARRNGRRALFAILLLSCALALYVGLPYAAWGATHKADPATGTKTLRIVSDEPTNRWDYDGSGISTRLRWLDSQETGNYVYCINPGVNEGPGEGTVSLRARLLEEDDFES